MSLLGLDVGTTGCKAVAFNLEGQILSAGYREYSLSHPQPGWSELDSELIWERVKEVIAEAVSRTKSDPIQSLSVSVQGEAVTPVDKEGKSLYPFSVSFDQRTHSQCQWWESMVGKKKLFQITGMPLHPMYTINKIMWFKQQRPDIYSKTWKFLCVEDFINLRLGADAVMDYSLAGRTMAFDVRKKRWSEEILSLGGVERELLPQVEPSGARIGEVAPELAQELGLGKGVIIATGGHDQPCGALGAGIVEEGMAMNATGTSDVICPAFRNPILTQGMLENNYCCYPHVYEDMFVTIAFNLTGGLLLRWYRDTLCQKEVKEANESGRDVYDLIVEQASDEIARAFILPHFVGSGTPTLDSASRGAILGLALDTTKADLSRAVLDSTNYEMKLNIERMEKVGIKIEELRAIGGGAKSERWLQLKADTFGKRILTLEVSEAACLGAAMLGGLAAGVFPSLKEAVERMVTVKQVYEPEPAAHAKFEEKYAHFIQIYPLLKDFNHRLSSSE